jgi:hypothetical protein
MAKERAIAMKIIYCRRCAQENFIGDDGLCEDCRELIALRGKVLMKQSRIDEQEKEIKRLEELAVELQHNNANLDDAYSTAEMVLEKLREENTRLRDALELFAESSNWCEHRYQDSQDRWILDYIWNSKSEPMEVADEALNSSASGKTRKGGKDE